MSDRRTSRARRRLFDNKEFYHPDKKAKFHAIEYHGADEKPDEEFPLILTSGRVVYQYLSGNQTRRIGFLVQQCPEPYVEIHPETAMKLKINDGERVKVVSRRGEGIFPALVVRTIRPGHDLYSVSLGRTACGEPTDQSEARSDIEDPGIQGVRRADREDPFARIADSRQGRERERA